MLQHVSIIILIIFRDLVSFLLKSLNLKFLKFNFIKVYCVDAATKHLVCVRGLRHVRTPNVPEDFDVYISYLLS